MSGLGLDDFLNHGKDSGGGKFFNWKKDGQAEVWISTRGALAYPRWSHTFPVYGVKEEDDNKGGKREVAILRRPRFVSPDAEIIHKEQYFRYGKRDNVSESKIGLMKKPPVIDPFLLLREHLREEIESGRLSEDTVVFRWENPDPREWESKIEEWHAGHLARLVDKTKKTWAHNLDTKLEYLFVVVNDSAPDDGPQTVTCAKLLGEQMQKEIASQIDSNGRDAGNPLISPYCFRWVYDKDAKNFNNAYRAYRYNKATLTDEIRTAIQDSDFDDPTPMTKPRAGDKARIRAAMEDAARIDLPYDKLFLDKWDDGEDDGSHGANTSSGDEKTMGSDASDSDSSEQRKSASKPATSSSSKSGGRRKKASKPDPKPEPTFEIVACDECQYPMHERWIACPQCGQAYELESGGMKPPPIEKLKAAKWHTKHAIAEEPTAEPEPEAEEKPEEDAATGHDECWACQASVGPDDKKCPGCGIDLGDDIPNL